MVDSTDKGTDYQRRRRADQETENAAQVAKGTRALGEAQRALGRSMRCFSAVRAVRGSPERHELGYLVRQVEDALQALRRAKRGSFIDFSDPDLAMDDPDLEG